MMRSHDDLERVWHRSHRRDEQVYRALLLLALISVTALVVVGSAVAIVALVEAVI